MCGSIYIYKYMICIYKKRVHTYHVYIYTHTYIPYIYIYTDKQNHIHVTLCDSFLDIDMWVWFNYAVYTFLLFLPYSFSCFWIFVRPLSHTQDVGQFAWAEAHALRCTKQLREGLRSELLCKPLIVGPEEPDVRDAEEHLRPDWRMFDYCVRCLGAIDFWRCVGMLRSTGPSTLIAGGLKGNQGKADSDVNGE